MNEHKKYVENAIKIIIEKGYFISVFDTEEIVNLPSNDINNVLADLFHVDEEYLYIYDKDNLNIRLGWVHLIYVNDPDESIADYTMNLDEVMQSIRKK